MEFLKGYIEWVDGKAVRYIKPEESIVPSIMVTVYKCPYCGTVTTKNHCESCGAPTNGGKRHE